MQCHEKYAAISFSNLLREKMAAESKEIGENSTAEASSQGKGLETTESESMDNTLENSTTEVPSTEKSSENSTVELSSMEKTSEK